MKCRCSNCGWLEVIPSGAMFCGYSNERTWEYESCLAWKDKDEPKTNADRIRSMTDEELGFLIAWNSYETPPWCREHEECPFIGLDPVPCEKCALDWLKQEAAE